MVSRNLVPGSVRQFCFYRCLPNFNFVWIDVYPRDPERNIPRNNACISPPVPQNVERSFCFCCGHFDSFWQKAGEKIRFSEGVFLFQNTA